MITSRPITVLAAAAVLAALATLPDSAEAQFRRGFTPSFSQRPIVAPKIAALRVVKPRTLADNVRTKPVKPVRVVGKPSSDDVGTVGRPPKRDDGGTKPPKRNPDGNPNPPQDGTGRPDRPKKPPVVVDRPPIVKPPIKVGCEGGRVVRGICQCPPTIGRAATNGGTNCGPVVGIPPSQPERPDRPIPPRIPPIVTVVPALPALIEPWPPRAPNFAPPSPPPRLSRPATPPPVPFVPTPAMADAAIVPDEVILSVPASASTDVEDGIAQRFNLTLLERTTIELLDRRTIRYRIPDGRLVLAVVAALAQDASAIGPQPNILYRPQQASAAPSSASLQYALAKVELAAAHGLATGRGAVVGIIDSGVDITHGDLRESDIVTFDAAGGDTAADGHGTAIAGIIGARGTTRGIAPSARLLSARAFAAKKVGAPQLTTSYVLLKALDWTVAEKARVVNLSLAGPEDPIVRTAVKAAIERGVIVVAAAGNNGRKAPAAYPAAYPGVIAATAIDADDRLYDKANVGTYVAIAAPGVDVIAPAAAGTHELHSGTSFAAAHVTGIIALMLERKPDSTPDEVRVALMKSAFDLGRSGLDDEFGAGRVNAAEALKLVASARAN